MQHVQVIVRYRHCVDVKLYGLSWLMIFCEELDVIYVTDVPLCACAIALAVLLWQRKLTNRLVTKAQVSYYASP